MKIRILSLARDARVTNVSRVVRVTTSVAVAAVLIAGCTAVAVYKNGDTCEQAMRSKLADTTTDPLKIVHTGAGIDATRVVVEGTIDHLMSASEVATADAASAAAAAALAAKGPHKRVARAAGASGALGAPGASGAASTTAGGSGEGASAVSVSAGADAASSASAAQVASQKSGKKPRRMPVPAGAECTFSGNDLLAFHWLSPAKLANPPVEASDAAE